MRKRKDEPEMVYAKTLTDSYSFTRKLIEMLGDADKEVTNKNHKSGPPAKLYRLDRVHKFVREHPEEFARARRRSEAASRGVKTKEQKLNDILDKIPLRLTRALPETFAELKRIARANAQDRHGFDARDPGPKGIIATFRHEFTNYEDLLSIIRSKVGASDAYESMRDTLNELANDLLTQKYPEWQPVQFAQSVSRNRKFPY